MMDRTEATAALVAAIHSGDNNTGGPPPGGVLELPDTEWRHAFDSILMSALRLSRSAIPVMRRVTFEVEYARQSLNATAQNKAYSVCPRSGTSAESNCGDSIFDRKLKAGEPLKTVEHEELRRRLKAMGVPLED
jgi:hypothetical protein